MEPGLNRTAIIVARDNGYGLSVDARLLMEELRSCGISGKISTPRGRGLADRLTGRCSFDYVVHLERVFPGWVSAGRHNILIPNQERFPRRQIGRLRHIDTVFAKTRHAEAIFSGLGVKTIFTGFRSEDRRLSDAEKNWNRFFHLAGGSTEKGTEAIVALWSAHPEWPQLILVQKADNATSATPANITLIKGFLADSELRSMQNGCGVHLCPSRNEGWGHHIHEAMSCGAVVLTTDAPPMNEFIGNDCGITVSFAHSEPRHLGTSYFADAAALESAIQRLLALPDSEKSLLGEAAAAAYAKTTAEFQGRFQSAMTGFEQIAE